MSMMTTKSIENIINTRIDIMCVTFTETAIDIDNVIKSIGEICSNDESIVWGTKVISRIYFDETHNSTKIEYVDPNDIDATKYVNEFTCSELYSFLFLLSDLLSNNKNYKRTRMLSISKG